MPGFRDFDAARFLRESWQKRPLLIRNPWRDWANPLAPDELAGLACESDIESRLVRHTGPGHWELEHGPFEPHRFGELGASPWTLLVQAVDHHVPEVAELIEPFRFVPDWRIDDVMVSYATDGGGVGPHFDQYDVFLVQGLGRRRWSVGPKADGGARLLSHEGLRLLADFKAMEEYVLEPGDILYLPPGFAHDGVAVSDECMTYSIGFRAPSRGDLVSAWADHVLDTLAEDDRYTDGDLDPGANPGEITEVALARLRDMVTGAVNNGTGFASWVGQYVTAPRDERIDWAPDEHISEKDLVGGPDPLRLERNPASRFSFIRQGSKAVTLFVDGTPCDCAGPAARLAERLCAASKFVAGREELAVPEVSCLIVDLVNRGALALVDEE